MWYWISLTNATWSHPNVWTNNLGGTNVMPVVGGSNEYVITFQPNITYTSWMNRGASFQLNRLVFNAGTVTLFAGVGGGGPTTNLVFRANNAGALPMFIQNSAGPITLGTAGVAVAGVNVILSNDTIFAGTGTGTVTIEGQLSGPGALIKSNAWALWTMLWDSSAITPVLPGLTNVMVHGGTFGVAITNAQRWFNTWLSIGPWATGAISVVGGVASFYGTNVYGGTQTG
ncbi:MAG: hypothetical protein N3A53_06090, partial [Verrucomicrobiae bacterium]|nr:hypothetical protein [Verrucomicrobiae bacterium]